MKKKNAPSQMTLYGIAAGVVLLGGTIVSVKSSLFPEPIAPCPARYTAAIDFPAQSSQAQPINVREVQTKLGFDEWGLAENVNVELAKNGPFSSVFEIALPEGVSGKQDSRGRKGGMGFSWKPGIPAGATGACLSYGVRLPANFDFDKGGVLPGIFGGEQPRAGRTGFATRIHWGPNGSADVVANLPGTGERGVSLAGGAWTFSTGRWVQIEQEVRLNTPGQADGALAIWVDGELRVDLKDLSFRGHENVRIDGVLADVFYVAPAPADASVQITNFNLRWK